MALTTEILPLLARRERLLEQIHGGAQSKMELAETLAVSRSTIDRSVRTLTTAGVLERRQTGYGLTLTGRLLYEQYRSFSECVESLAAAQQLLSSLPAGTELPPEAVVGSSVTYPEPTAPYRPMERHIEMIRTADEVDLVATAIAPRFIDVYRSQVLTDGLDVRAVLGPSVAERVVTDYGETVTELMAAGGLTVRELTQQPPFPFSVIRTGETTHLSLLVYGTEGSSGYLVNDRPAATAFATELFDSYWSEATTLPVGDPRISS